MLENRRALVGALVVLAAAGCFGTLGPVSRLAFQAGLAPLGFTAWRALLGGLLLLGLVRWRMSRGASFAALRHLPGRQRANLGVAAISSFVLNLAIFVAFSRVSVALALLGFYTYPAMVAVAGTLTLGEPLDRPRLVALGLALLGMVLVVAGQLEGSGPVAIDLLGFGMALLAAVAQTVYITVGRSGYPAVPTEQATTVILLSGGMGYMLTAVLTGGVADVTFAISEPSLWPILLFAGTIGAAVPVLLFLTGVRWIGGTRTAILAMFEPVTGVVLAALILGESIHPVQIAGGALVLLAGALLQRGPAAVRPPEPPAEQATPALI